MSEPLVFVVDGGACHLNPSFLPSSLPPEKALKDLRAVTGSVCVDGEDRLGVARPVPTGEGGWGKHIAFALSDNEVFLFTPQESKTSCGCAPSNSQTPNLSTPFEQTSRTAAALRGREGGREGESAKTHWFRLWDRN